MPETALNVVLLRYTPKPEETIALAGRLCYSPVGVPELQQEMSDDEKHKLLKLLLRSGHHSPLEHASFTFAIEGISRACSHQLVRHRIASYSQQSQRYVSAEDFQYVIPPVIAGDEESKRLFEDEMNRAAAAYRHQVESLLARGRTKEQAQEDARFLLPNAAETKIVVTMNARELIHTSNVRLCNRAQWEIRRVFRRMKALVADAAPTIEAYMASKCDERFLGYCPEGRMSCGKMPLKEDVLKGVAAQAEADADADAEREAAPILDD